MRKAPPEPETPELDQWAALHAKIDPLAKLSGWAKAVAVGIFLLGAGSATTAFKSVQAVSIATEANTAISKESEKLANHRVDQAIVEAELLAAVKSLNERLDADKAEKKRLEARVERLEGLLGSRAK